MSTILKEAGDNISKQAAILEAGFEIFSENGFSDARLDDIARRAGVAKGTLYLYFDSKEELFKKVVEQSLILNIKPILEALETYDGPIKDFLDKAFEVIGHKLIQSRLGVFPKIILAEASKFPDLAAFYRDKVIVPIHGFFTRVIERGIEQGEFRDVDAEASARILMSPFLMLALVSQTPEIAEGFGLDPQKHIAAARDILENGLIKKEN